MVRAHAQPVVSVGCAISGTVTSGRTPLPGVALTLTTVDGRTVDATSTAVDGTFVLRAPADAELHLHAELVAFAPVSQPIAVSASRCDQRAELSMILASRAPAAEPASAAATTTPPPLRAAGPNGASTRPPAGRAGSQFQRLRVVADQNAGGDDEPTDAGDASRLLLPPGFSPDASSDAITSIGSSQAAGPIGFGDRPDFFGDGTGGPGSAGGPGATGAAGQRPFGGPGFGGGPRPGGGPGGPALAGSARPLRSNQIRATVFNSIDSSRLDAAPFSLNGQPTQNTSYLQLRLGATVGGPLVIPGLVSSTKTFFFANYTGNHASNPFDVYSTVPTVAERSGDLSALGRAIVDPATGQPFAASRIPASRQDAAALALLNLIPPPNQPGTTQNFYYQTTSGVSTMTSTCG